MTRQQAWDELYQRSDQVFSGAPNGVLVAEAAELPPGQALDVGCGEGADARWLARRGWLVTAVDISTVALRRAAAADTDTDTAGRIAWAHGDLTSMPPLAAAFDLVSVHYVPLPHEPGHTVLRRLLAAVAPGGTLLFVSHDPADLGPEHHGYYQPADVVPLLGDGWTVLVDETRRRTTAPPAGTRHTHDTVLRARRR